MDGRRLCTEQEAIKRGFASRKAARMRQILRETLAAFERAEPADRYHRLANENLDRWRAGRGDPGARSTPRIEIHPSDWGDLTRALTVEYGVCMAVLNMANAHVPGGGYVEGAAAQEENLFRRTDCHFSLAGKTDARTPDRYNPQMTRLLSAADGRVYLDVQQPRVCIRGPEDRSRSDLGYAWLPDDAVFPFYELRAAAVDLRGGADFDADAMRRRIAAQFDTLHDHGIRHAVLGAFGCGAFGNPARRVAELYRDQLIARSGQFDLVAFAIFHAGYGPDNITPFMEVFARSSP